MSDPHPSLEARLGEALADRYRIERALGQGGMATVYLAEDLKHHRKVAVKVLREDLAATMGATRFLREIEIAAQLQHPNILPLLDSGDAGGLLYYVMPYVPGQSLRERIAREGELPVPEAVQLISEVVDALAHAHAQGVVHRDIKPDNVMLSGRHALVTDFGVAKAVSEATDRNTITTLGVAIGTPAYMSPEQSAADPHVDQRSDIYSVGAMAYELLTGRPPFVGGTPQQVLAAHVTEAPDALSKRRPGIPPGLDAVLMRCLAKRPADRWQTADELHAALEAFRTPSGGVTPTQTTPVQAVSGPRRRWWIAAAAVVVLAGVAWWRFGATGGGGSIHTIAVIPFKNVGHDTARDYLAEGMANDIREALMKLPGLTVKARTSSEAAQGKPIHQAGTLLDVGALLQGEFHPAGDHITVTVDLVKVADETGLWSHDYVLPPDGNFSSAQDSITAAVAKALQLAVPPSMQGTAQHRGTSDQEAYDLYLKGQFFFAKRGVDNLRRAMDYFHRAIGRDSMFARAYAGLSLVEGIVPIYTQIRGDSIVRDAEAMARRAVALNPKLAEGHVALADALWEDLRTREGVSEFQTAIQLDPRNVTAHQWYSEALMDLARVDEAVHEGQAAVDLDPLSPIASSQLSYVLLCAGRYGEAISAGRRALELDPTLPLSRLYLGAAEAFAGQRDSAIVEFDRLFEADSTFPLVRASRVWRFALASRWADAEREAATAARTETGDSRNFSIALAQVALGNNQAALDALAGALRARSSYFSSISLGCDPSFSPLRGDPRFAAILKAVGQKMCGGTVPWPIPVRPGAK